MDFRRLYSTKDALFAEAFALCKASTTVCEQRSLDKQIALMANYPSYHFDAIMEGDALAGILLYWELMGYTYVEHFALHPLMCNLGMGRKALTMFCGTRPLVVLEIDPPVNEVTAARDMFSQLNDFMPNEYVGLYPVSRERFFPRGPIVMSYPEKLTEQQYRRIQRDMKEIVMKDDSFPYMNQCKEWQ
jgi:MinD-like ATPase involved in chromosome partitioning or flagellar assembly